MAAADLHAASAALGQLVQAAGEQAQAEPAPEVEGAPVPAGQGNASQDRSLSIIEERHELFMLAAMAYLSAELESRPRVGGPIAAIVAWEVEDISKTPLFVIDRNRNQERQSGLSHAEMTAIEKAYAAKPAAVPWKGWLNKATLYATLEPCPMCASAMIVQHVPEAYYCAQDPSLRDAKSPERKRTVPLLEEYHGRSLEIRASSLAACLDLNRSLWRKVDEAPEGKEFPFIDHLRGEHKLLFGPFARALRSYAPQHEENERLFELLKAQALPPE